MATDSGDLAHQLWEASRWGSPDRVRSLLRRGADPTSLYTRQGLDPPLLDTCWYNVPTKTSLLLRWGARVSDVNERGWTALHVACYCNYKDCVKILMDHGSSTDVKNKDGKTPVDLALDKGHHDLVMYILRYKSPPRDPLSTYPSIKQLNQLRVGRWQQLCTHFRLTEYHLEAAKQIPLAHPKAVVFVAAKLMNEDLKWNQVVESLLRVGEYELAEHICSKQEGSNSWLEFVKYLVDTVGLNPTEPLSKDGPDTLLSVACARSHIGVIDYLVRVKGCDPFGPVNDAGDTLQSIANSHQLSEVIDYLRDLPADSAREVKEDLHCRDEPVAILPINWIVSTDMETNKPVYRNSHDPEALSFEPPGYPLTQTKAHPNVTFYGPPKEMEFTVAGGHKDFNNGVEVTIPPNAVPPGATLEVKVQPSFAPSDVFVLPEGIQSASPSYLISTDCARPTELSGEVTVTMEHHVKLSTREETSDLVFLQANTVPKQSASGYLYEYHEVSEGRSEFNVGEVKGRLTLKAIKRKLLKVGRKVKKLFKGPDRNLYTLRVYRSPPQTAGNRLCVVIVSLLQQVFFEFLKKFEDDMLHSEYGGLSRDGADRTIKEPLNFAKLETTIKVVCGPQWSSVVDHQVISKDSVDLPVTGNFKPEELHSYPPKMVCRFLPGDGAQSVACTMMMDGFNKQVSVDMALMVPRPQVTVDTTKLQVAAGILRNSASKVVIPQLGEAVEAVIAVTDLLTSAIGSSSLSHLATHIASIKTQIKTVVAVSGKVVKECTRPSVSKDIEARLPKIEGLCHQLCQVTKVKLKHCTDDQDRMAALSDLVNCGVNLLNSVDHLLKDIQMLGHVDISSPELLPLHKVWELTKSLCSEWYSLAVELDIPFNFPAIERNHSSVEDRHREMLGHWVRRTSPPPSWSALLRALKSPVIDCGGIVKAIENEVTGEPQYSVGPRPQLDPHDPLSVDIHLKLVREVTWDVRAKWFNFGFELGISKGTLDAIQHNHHYLPGACLTDVLEHWLGSSPDWTDLIQALESPPIGCQNIAVKIKTIAN